jgi:hypothetical protein
MGYQGTGSVQVWQTMGEDASRDECKSANDTERRL